MKLKVSELSEIQLNWAVLTLEGYVVRVLSNSNGRVFLNTIAQDDVLDTNFGPNFAINWKDGGPIIAREIWKIFKNVGGTYTAQIKHRIHYYSPTYDADVGTDAYVTQSGDTMLEAAMRCYVSYKLGDEVDIPEALL